MKYKINSMVSPLKTKKPLVNLLSNSKITMNLNSVKFMKVKQRKNLKLNLYYRRKKKKTQFNLMKLRLNTYKQLLLSKPNENQRLII